MNKKNELDFDALNASVEKKEESKEENLEVQVEETQEDEQEEDLNNILSQFSEKNIEEESVNNFSLDSYISKLMNLEEGKFLTGDSNNPIEVEVKDLNEKQKIALLEYHFKNQKQETSKDNNTLNEDEKLIIDSLREGKIEDVYYGLQTELAYNGKLNNVEEKALEGDDLLIWNIKQEYPDFDDDEIETELHVIKETPNLERKLKAAEEKYLKFTKEENDRKLKEQELTETEHYDLLKKDYQKYSDSFDLGTVAKGFVFEPEEEEQLKKEALSEIFDEDKLTKELESPEGLYKTAIMRSIFPKILDYVKEIENNNRELKLKNKSSERISSFTKNDKVKEENIFENLKFLESI